MAIPPSKGPTTETVKELKAKTIGKKIQAIVGAFTQAMTGGGLGVQHMQAQNTGETAEVLDAKREAKIAKLDKYEDVHVANEMSKTLSKAQLKQTTENSQDTHVEKEIKEKYAAKDRVVAKNKNTGIT